jgi:predicted ATPase/DNA-binding SARP family transcriptional activator
VARLALATLGDVALYAGERCCELPSTAKARLVLVYLALQARAVSRDELAAIAWPEIEEERARASLSTALWAIRKALRDAGADVDPLTANRKAVALAVEIDVDAARFERAADSGDDAEADRIYTGPFLRDEYCDWAVAQRERLAHRAEAVLLRLVEASADPLSARRLLATDTYAEAAYRVLIDDALARGRFATAQAYAKRALDAFAEIDTVPALAADPRYAAVFDDAGDARQRTNLGLETTSFVGRDRDLDHVGRLLDEHRLVTLVGPGGTGKTRLAREAASRAVARHPDGAWFVDLAPLADDADIDVAALRALGVREDPARPAARVLDAALAHRDIVLVFDNCEHVADAVAAVVDRILRAAPLARVLATSREPLRLAGEWLVDVDPLVIDDAAALFAERARAADRRFELADEPARRAVLEICAAVDGLPLAIELVAARVRYDDVGAIRASLREEPTGPVGTLRYGTERVRSLRASIAWSVGRLEPHARVTFGRLGIFAGAFDESGAIAVAVAEARGVLDALVGRSLVGTVDVRGQRRYRLLETTRAYARELMSGDGDAAAVRAAFARYTVDRAIAACARLLGPSAPSALLELDDAVPDVSAALGILFDTGANEEAVTAVFRIARYWSERGAHAHAEPWFARAAALDVPAQLRGELAYARALVKKGAVDNAAMESLLRESLACFEAARDVHGQARCWNSLGIVEQNRRHFAAARAAFEKSVMLQRELGDRLGIAYALSNLATNAIHDGEDYLAAERFYDDAIPLFDELATLTARVSVYINLARVKGRLGARAAADRALATALALAEKTGSDDVIAFAYASAACQAASAGAYETVDTWCRRAGSVAAPASVLAEALVARACALHAAGEAERARRCLAAALEARARSGSGFEALESELIAGLPFTVDDAVAAAAGVLDLDEMRALLQAAGTRPAAVYGTLFGNVGQAIRS